MPDKEEGKPMPRELRNIDISVEATKKLEESVEKCDSEAPGFTLRAARFAEMAFSDKEIDEDALTNQMDKIGILTTKFRHNCFCTRTRG